MTTKQRPAKTFRLNYYKLFPELDASIVILGEPAEVRIKASKDSFIGVRDGGMTLSPGRGGKINVQGMPNSLRYGGMLSAPPFPLQLLPSTGVTPIPSIVFNPPFKELVKTLATMSTLATSFLG